LKNRKLELLHTGGASKQRGFATKEEDGSQLFAKRMISSNLKSKFKMAASL